MSARPAGYKMPGSSSHSHYSSVSRSYGSSYDTWRNYSSPSVRPIMSRTSSYIADYKPSYSSLPRTSSVPLSIQASLLTHNLGSKFLNSSTLARDRFERSDSLSVNSTSKIMNQTKSTLEPTLNGYTTYKGGRHSNFTSSTSVGDVTKYSPKYHKFSTSGLPVTADIRRTPLRSTSSTLSELERPAARRSSILFANSENCFSKSNSWSDRCEKSPSYSLGNSTSRMPIEGKISTLKDGLNSVRVSSPIKEQKFMAKDAGSLPKTERGLIGMQNIGNTCFLNSVVQCLSNTKEFMEYILSADYMCEINYSSSMHGALIKAFSEMLNELWQRKVLGKAVNPSVFKNQIQRFASRFIGNHQQDAQEFLRYLLEGLHEDVNRVKIKSQYRPLDLDVKLSAHEKAVEAWKCYLRHDSSKIVDLFVGQLKSSLSCTKCGNCSITFDPFWDLSLPIPDKRGAINITECLDLFTKEEILSGEERPECSVCQERQRSTKSFKIQKFPKILVLHLKRFSSNPEGSRRSKLSSKVDFPIRDFDLHAYASEGGVRCNYNLYGVVHHSGSTRGGHYIAYCKHPHSDKWYEYNDTRVSTVSTHSFVTSDAYLLFYEMRQDN